MGSLEVPNTPLVTQFELPVGFSRPKVFGSLTALEVPGGIAAAVGDSGAVSTLNYGKGTPIYHKRKHYGTTASKFWEVLLLFMNLNSSCLSYSPSELRL